MRAFPISPRPFPASFSSLLLPFLSPSHLISLTPFHFPPISPFHYLPYASLPHSPVSFLPVRSVENLRGKGREKTQHMSRQTDRQTDARHRWLTNMTISDRFAAMRTKSRLWLFVWTSSTLPYRPYLLTVGIGLLAIATPTVKNKTWTCPATHLAAPTGTLPTRGHM